MLDLQALVHRTVDGDLAAWGELQAAVEPTILAIARRHRELRQRGLAALPDDLAEIVAATLERLARGEFQNLRDFVARQRQADGPQTQSFDAWLYGAVDFAVRDHLRKRFGRAPKLRADAAPRAQPSKRDLQSQAGRLDGGVERSFLHTLGMTAKLTAAEIFKYVEATFTAEEALALRLYYREDCSWEEIATRLTLPDAGAAERLVRRLNARLRYHFVEGA